MNHHVLLAYMCTIIAAQAQANPSSGYGITKYARDGTASVADGGRLEPSARNTMPNADTLAEELNQHLARDYLIALAGLTFVLLLHRLFLHLIHYTRTLACLNNNTQRYFATTNTDWTNFKLHFLYAPLFKSRHKREIRLSTALSMGTLPTRFQSMLLLAVVAANITLCVYGLPWHESATDVLPVLRNRTGSIAVANLLPVMLLSSPKNPLIKLLNIPFDSMNIIHRNLARLAIFEAVVHTLCYIIGTVKTSKSWLPRTASQC